MDERYDPTLQRMAALADVIKVSDEDLRGLFRCDDAEQAFGRLRGMNPNAIYLYTQGANGAQLHHGPDAWHAPAPHVVVMDTVGAGDASMGALLYSLSNTPSFDGEEHLRFAVAAGAVACTKSGATPPSLEEVEALMPKIAVGHRR